MANVGTAAAGKVLIGAGNGASPNFASIGTNSGLTAYSVITGGTTSSGPFQNVSGVGNSGEVLTSNGAGVLPSWQSITFVSQPKFFAYQNTSISNVTGDSTVYNIPFNTVLYDTASGYNTGNGNYTVPVTGYWLFSCMVYMNNISVGHTNANILLLTPSNTYRWAYCNPFSMAANNAVLQLGGTTVVHMNQGDTATIQLFVANSTKTIGIDSNNIATYFNGTQLA